MKRRNPEINGKTRKYPKRSRYGDGSLGVRIVLGYETYVIGNQRSEQVDKVSCQGLPFYRLETFISISLFLLGSFCEVLRFLKHRNSGRFSATFLASFVVSAVNMGEKANRNRGRMSVGRKLWNNKSKAIFLAIKLLVIWMVIVALDFAIGLRVEYFWTVWLMGQSVLDAYKYQGIGFTVFFISMVVTSDILVYMFVPTACMFFLASLYVWIQLMMLSGIERGVCVQTIVIWMVFLYIEATMRLREIKSDPNMPFHWDICRPFAAHCVGYPLVTFSFSVKSFISFKYRKHKQLQIATENKLFRDLINEALPEDSRRPQPEALLPLEAKGSVTNKSISDTAQTNGFIPVENGAPTGGTAVANSSHNHHHSESRSAKRKANNNRVFSDVLSVVSITQKCDDNISTGSSGSSSVADSEVASEWDRIGSSKKQQHLTMELDNCDGESVESEKGYKLSTRREGKNNRSTSPNVSKSSNNYEKESVSGSSSSNAGRKQKGSTSAREGNLDSPPKQEDSYLSRLESDLKRLRSDLQLSRNMEQDLRTQISALQSGDKSAKADFTKMQQDNESLQQRLNNLLAARQQDKTNVALYEKKYTDERKSRQQLETQLTQERKQRQVAENAGSECSDTCKVSRKDLENDLRQLRRDIVAKEEKIKSQADEIASLRQSKESEKDAVASAQLVSSLHDKNAHLEHSLGQETKLKLDLFSALGEAKRQLEVSQNVVGQRDKEIGELKQKISRIAEAMTLLPPSVGNQQSTISAFVQEALKHQTPTHSRLQQDKQHVTF